MRLILIYMTRPTVRITESLVRERERGGKGEGYRGMRGNYKFMLLACVYNIYTHMGIQRPRCSSPRFREPPCTNPRPFPCFRWLYVTLFGSANMKTISMTRIAQERPALFAEASFDDSSRINISMEPNHRKRLRRLRLAINS